MANMNIGKTGSTVDMNVTGTIKQNGTQVVLSVNNINADSNGNVAMSLDGAKNKHIPSATTKAYVTGTSTSTQNNSDDYFDTGVYLSSTSGRLETGSVTVGATSGAVGKCAMVYNTADECVSFIFN